MKYIRLHDLFDQGDIALNVEVIAAIFPADDEEPEKGSNIWTMEPERKVPIEVAESFEEVLRLIDEATT